MIPPSPLHVAMVSGSKLELCHGDARERPLVAVTSWVYTDTPPPEGPPILLWRSLNPEIAKVTAGGNLTPVAIGRTIVEVEASLGGHRATTRAEVNLLAGRLDQEATQRTGKLVCGR